MDNEIVPTIIKTINVADDVIEQVTKEGFTFGSLKPSFNLKDFLFLLLMISLNDLIVFILLSLIIK